MTIFSEWKTCPACHKKYSPNPDLGHFRCPHCGGLGDGKRHVFRKFFDKKRDTSERRGTDTKESV